MHSLARILVALTTLMTLTCEGSSHFQPSSLRSRRSSHKIETQKSTSAYEKKRPTKLPRFEIELLKKKSANLQQVVEDENHQMEEATRLQLNGKTGDRQKMLASIFSPERKENEFQEAETLQQLQEKFKNENENENTPRGASSSTYNKHLPDMQPKEDPLEKIRQRKLKTGSAYAAKRLPSTT